jgi:hypothetical protein
MNAQSMGYAMANVSIQWDLTVVCVSQDIISMKASVLVSTKHELRYFEEITAYKGTESHSDFLEFVLMLLSANKNIKKYKNY